MNPFILAESTRSRINHFWELLYVLVERNLKTRYRGSLLGIYWSLLNPLIMTALYAAIFGKEFSRFYDDSLLNYILAAFTGLASFHFFTGASSQALTSIVANGALINKISLPIGLFPVSIIAANTFQFALGTFPLLAIVTLIRSQDLSNVIALIAVTLSLVVLSTGFAAILSSLYVFFRDLSYLYELISFVLWLGSAVFYPIEIVPSQIRPFVLLNPLTPIIESIRQISLSGEPPDLTLIVRSWLNAIVLLTAGIITFRKLRPHLVDLL